MAFYWCANDGPTLNAGLVVFLFFRGFRTVLLRNPLFLQFISRVGVKTPCPPLDPRMSVAFYFSFMVSE